MELSLKNISCIVAPVVAVWFLFLRRHTFGRRNKKIVFKDGTPSKEYNLNMVWMPSLRGMMARIIDRLYNSIIGDVFLLSMTARKGNLQLFRGFSFPEFPTILPVVPTQKKLAIHSTETLDLWQFIKPRSKTSTGFEFTTISDLIDAYRSGRVTPTQVAEAALAAMQTVEEMPKPMRIFVDSNKKDILQMAHASTERYKRNEPLSVFDGIPISVKDCNRLLGCIARAGVSAQGVNTSCEADESNLVKKLRQGGAVILGLTNMFPLGMGVFSYNGSRYHGTSRNPYNVDYTTSGSSGGAAAAVAAGINVMAVGSDGGGSVRLPAACCGVVGVKPTFGRITAAGKLQGAQTVVHVGPLTNNVRDAAISYAFLAGPDEQYPPGLQQPEVSLDGFDNLDLSGIRLGIDHAYFKDCDPEVYDACWQAVTYLKTKCNATIVDINIPELKESQIAHVITIGTEYLAAHHDLCVDHYDELDHCCRTFFLGITKFSALDYVQAQKQRTRSMNNLKEIFKSVDCLITPTLPILAPKLEPAAFKTGEFNALLTSSMMKYVVLGNLTGVPCLALPVGYGRHGLPISLQIWTPWFEEALMFRIAHAAEGVLKSRPKPQVYFSLQ